ncbi:GNAT family N-acetyltransferase [Oceanobacillus neutriphilus]|uniref:Acetyltransferase n=1 Tax=Oceanobacillus neutriphilus TaxID=531815 RepID=A0ABQ2NR37_9BACI|nr:GNAT family N-acetyltransferase [Oceanobacillus neutriphilus]GGP09160.1 acetyltransferase [Oceanobacillus neutriphilus]
MKWEKAAEKDYISLIQLWEKSVLATHHFLDKADREAIKTEIPAYFPQLDMKMWYQNDRFIGFSGVNEKHLEMLFLDPRETGYGFGSNILTSLIENDGINSVDVNEDNKQAADFYLKNGFQVISKSKQDDQGRNYPILHLALKKL